jgi:hypothetical protein
VTKHYSISKSHGEREDKSLHIFYLDGGKFRVSTTLHQIKATLKKGKGIPVTGHEGPYDCETLRFPHFLDNRLTDGSEAVILRHRPPFTHRKIRGTFLLEVESTPVP